MERPRGDAVNPGPPAPNRGDRAFDDAMGRLSEPQRAAVEHPSPALCVVAAAGSGKTTVLTLRVARRVRDDSADADHSVVCTFTRSAAAELRDRLAAYGLPVSVTGPGRVPTPGVRVGTIHQLARTLIRRHCIDNGKAVPVIVDQRTALLRQVCEGPAAAAALAAEIGWAKSRGLAPDEYEEAVTAVRRHAPLRPEEVVAGFRAYQLALHRRGGLDLDDLLVRAADLLVTDAGFAERMRWRYRHLAVDEFQDVNPAQCGLLLALLGDSRDLCVVGDPHQAIYGWNGADPSLLERLPDLVGPLAVIELTDNHRSSPQIVRTADAVLGAARSYRPRSVSGDGPEPSFSAYEDEWAEAEGIADVLVDGHGEGVPWAEQAVLARTHDQLSVVARALGRAGVPYRLSERSSTDDDADSWGGPGPESAVEAVELATFHRAKGAEWTSVCVAGVEDGFVPIVYATDDLARAEERRLLYVALTRPSRHLACSWARNRTTAGGRMVEREPSPWFPADAGRVDPPRDRRRWSERDHLARRLADLRAALHGGR